MDCHWALSTGYLSDVSIWLLLHGLFILTMFKQVVDILSTLVDREPKSPVPVIPLCNC